MGLKKKIEDLRWNLWYKTYRLSHRHKGFTSGNKSLYATPERLSEGVEYRVDGKRVHQRRERVLRLDFTPRDRQRPARNMIERIDTVEQGIPAFLQLLRYLRWRPWRRTIIGTTNRTMADFAVKNLGFRRVQVIHGDKPIVRPSGYQDITATRRELLSRLRQLKKLSERMRARNDRNSA